MKDYMLFAGDNYYPAGGFLDFKGFYSSIEDARHAATFLGEYDWYHIVCTDKFTIVDKGTRR